MADTTNPNAAAPGAGGENLTKARAEFDRYRARMSDRHSGNAADGPFGRGMPMFSGAPMAGGPAVPPFYGAAYQMPPYQASSNQTAPPFPPQMMPLPFAGGGPLFENIGRMMQMGVTFATAAFTGGMQMMQGFGGAPYGGMHPGGGHHDRCESEPHHQRHHRDDCGCHDDHCGDSHGYDECCCSPGVSNCGCCCG